MKGNILDKDQAIMERIKEEVRNESIATIKNMEIEYDKVTKVWILTYDATFYWEGDREKLNETVFKKYGYEINNIHIYPKDTKTIEVTLFFKRRGF